MSRLILVLLFCISLPALAEGEPRYAQQMLDLVAHLVGVPPTPPVRELVDLQLDRVIQKAQHEPTLYDEHFEETTQAQAGEEDYLLGMFAVLACDYVKARWHFFNAYRHNPAEKFVEAWVIGKRLLRRESERYVMDAEESESNLKEMENAFPRLNPNSLAYMLQVNLTRYLYLRAVECDPTNGWAIDGYDKAWERQFSSLTIQNRIRYR